MPVVMLLCLLLTLPCLAQPADTIIEGATVVTMDSQRRVLTPGHIVIRDGRIVSVGEGASAVEAREVIDARGKLIVPGLVNAHTHLPMVMFRGLADDLILESWLNEVIFPAEAANVNAEFVAVGTRLGLAELIQGGVTTFADMYYFEEVIAEETERAGMRAVLGQTVLDFPAPDHKTWEAALEAVRKFATAWSGNPLVKPAIAPHAPYTVGKQHWLEVNALAQELDIPILTHLAEAPLEVEHTIREFGQRPVPFLQDLGLLTPRLVGAHGIYINSQEMEVLASNGVGLCHCPESNMKVAVGVSPVPDLLKKGVAVGLGTDGAASNNDLSMWQEMDTAAKLHKSHRLDPTTLGAADAFALATIGGARALHLDKEIGSLEPGKWADLAIIELRRPHLTPAYNVYSLLVYAVRADDVNDTMVAGRFLMRDRKLQTLDLEAIYHEVEKLIPAVAKSVKRGT